jgi:hypothetical protein
MREAHLHHDAARIALHMAPAIEARHRPALRRVGVPLLAATVWLGIAAGSIAAAQAGGPLYPTRMWLETATLPASGNARAIADLQHLDARLGEALAAATRGDRDAVAASLEAYAEAAEDARANATDPAVEATVEAALENHVAVLTAVADGLAAKGNDSAAEAIGENITRALLHNAAVLDTLANRHDGTGGTDNAGGTGAGTPSGDHGNGPAVTPRPAAGGNGPAETPRGNGTGGGGATAPTPTPADQPTATQTPGEPGKPDKPDHTPPGPH